MTKGAIYARVSSEEQKKTGYSIFAQLQNIERAFLTRGIEVAARFEEVHSAKAEGRPVFAQMLEFLLAHPNVRVWAWTSRTA